MLKYKRNNWWKIYEKKKFYFNCKTNYQSVWQCDTVAVWWINYLLRNVTVLIMETVSVGTSALELISFISRLMPNIWKF